ncbi:hypothetical protein BDU57DRAFT_532897 [Ampelomyces quisqualis]|uniref:Uncharacterized protein n=1 Tax=Ampelomyces quisqualis TaxID=50730 RepID=A0A6A5QAW1_AMPQU|nr:hypothetical protein BDU57DRAFT_532897 [Ampelomyces quisqualis]
MRVLLIGPSLDFGACIRESASYPATIASLTKRQLRLVSQRGRVRSMLRRKRLARGSGMLTRRAVERSLWYLRSTRYHYLHGVGPGPPPQEKCSARFALLASSVAQSGCARDEHMHKSPMARAAGRAQLIHGQQKQIGSDMRDSTAFAPDQRCVRLHVLARATEPTLVQPAGSARTTYKRRHGCAPNAEDLTRRGATSAFTAFSRVATNRMRPSVQILQNLYRTVLCAMRQGPANRAPTPKDCAMPKDKRPATRKIGVMVHAAQTPQPCRAHVSTRAIRPRRQKTNAAPVSDPASLLIGKAAGLKEMRFAKAAPMHSL